MQVHVYLVVSRIPPNIKLQSLNIFLQFYILRSHCLKILNPQFYMDTCFNSSPFIRNLYSAFLLTPSECRSFSVYLFPSNDLSPKRDTQCHDTKNRSRKIKTVIVLQIWTKKNKTWQWGIKFLLQFNMINLSSPSEVQTVDNYMKKTPFCKFSGL